MVDIKELMRTYVFINDPNVKEVTTKFGILLAGLGVATLGVWGLVTVAEDDPVTDPHAAETDDGSDGEAAADTQKDCVHEDDADDWRDEHADLLLSGNLLKEEQNGDYVCFTYAN